MRRILILQSFLLLVLFSCASNEQQLNQAGNENAAPADQEVKSGNSLLWRVDGADIETSYLFGTMHMIDREYFHFPDFLQSKIKSSESIIMEVDGIPNPLSTYQMMLLDSGSVHRYFDQEQLVELLAFMDTEMGISPQEFDLTYGKMKPFFIMQSITQSYFEADAQSYDLLIMALAGEHHIPIIGLESTEEQLGFFDQMAPEEMANIVMESARSYEQEQEDMEKLMKLYARQKVDKLIPLLHKQSPEFMDYADLFLYDRNRKWIPKLITAMQDKKCFVAVGAAHLFGEDGVIDLLRKKGYQLTPIDMNPEE